MRIYLAGAESMLNILAENNAKHVLATYYYLRNKSERTVERLLNTFPDVFLDSGGFSLNVSLVKEGMTWDEAQQDPRIANYLEEYARFVDKWGHRFTAVAELDVGPWEQKVRQREFLQQYTDRVIPVIHPTDPPEYQLYLMKNYEYVALGGVGDARSLTEIKSYVTRQLHRARKYNTLLHGFAITVVEIMRMLPFFSADSSVTGDSKVLVKENGVIRQTTIEELYNRRKLLEERTSLIETRVPYSNTQVLTVDENNKVVWGNLYGVVKHKVNKKLVKITTEDNKEVICTTDHSIIVMDKEGHLQEVKADELKKGDYVLTNSIIPHDKSDIPYIEVKILKPKTQKGVLCKRKVILDDTFLQFLGLWLGDGHFSGESTIGVSAYNHEDTRRVLDEIAQRYNAKASLNKNGVDWRISSVTLRREMEALGFKGASSTKEFPEFIFNLSKRQIAQVLKGYYSADGTTHNLAINTVSEKLKDGLEQLLLMLGIPPVINYYSGGEYNIQGKIGEKKPSYRISIHGRKYKQMFLEQIGFLQKEKNEALLEELNNEVLNGITVPKRELVPVRLLKDGYLKYPNANQRQRPTARTKRANRHVEGNFVDRIRDSELWFLEIKDIEVVSEGEEVVVYDLAVEKYERFFANGILVHNTSWLMGSKYGMTFWFDGRTLRSYDKFGKNVRRKFKREVMDLGLDWDKFINEHAKTVNRWNLLQWLQYQEYLNDTSGRGLGHFKAMQEHYFRKVEERNKKYQNLKGYNEWEIYGIK